MEEKKKLGRKGVIIVIAVLLILAAATLVLALLNRPENLPERGSVAIVSGEERRELTLAEIKALPYIEAEKEIISSSFEDDEGLFRGVALRALLESAGVDMSAVKQVIVRSEDGFVAVYPAEEVTEGDDIILAYSKNGEGLGSLADGGTGPLRIIVFSDEFGTRCAKYVSGIEVK